MVILYLTSYLIQHLGQSIWDNLCERNLAHLLLLLVLSKFFQ